MQYDCGITKVDDRFTPEPTLDSFFRGWQPGQDITELLVLVNTPGIPLQWVYAVLKLSNWYRAKLKAASESVSDEIKALGVENAKTVVMGDGMRMLRLLDHRDGYNGQVPLWSTLELQADPRSDRAVAEELGVRPGHVTSWRTSQVFDPLTGVRLKRPVGNPRAGEMHMAKRIRATG